VHDFWAFLFGEWYATRSTKNQYFKSDKEAAPEKP
jgi:hypothetical protein